MGTVVAAILSLVDNMSPKLLTVGKNWDNLSKSERRAAKSAIASFNSMQKRADKFVSSAAKWGAALAAAGIGAGFAEAFSLEKYRAQLETATKDTKRAAEVMTYAIKLANTTPFEGGDMAAAAAALEMASLKSETYLTTLGDTAAGVNKSISEVQTQFVKAFASGQTADFFQSISVSKTAFDDFTKANKLSTASLVDTQAALKKFLDQKFGGGMAKMATTSSGAWSTVTGVAKSALAQLVGMGTDGTVRTGSALDKLRNKMISISDTLVKFQQNGKLEKYTRDIGNGLEGIWNIGEKAFGTIFKFKDLIIPLGTFAASIWAITRAMTALKTIGETVRVVMLLLNGTLTTTPIGLVAAALAALGLAAYNILTYDNGINTPGEHESSSGETHSGGGGSFDNPKKSTFFKNFVYEFGYKLKPYADGTQYHTGGLALVGERGPELVNLPSGSRVTSAEKTAKLGGQIVVNNNFVINGARKSDQEIIDLVAKGVMEGIENSW